MEKIWMTLLIFGGFSLFIGLFIYLVKMDQIEEESNPKKKRRKQK